MISSLMSAQNSPLRIIRDFQISTENSPSTVNKNSPKIFYNGKDRILCAWAESKYGFFKAQFFDTLGNKIGNNFNIKSNEEVEFLNDSIFLNTKEFFGSGATSNYALYSLTGFLYNVDNLNEIQNSFVLFSEILPWCGTGWLGITTDVKKIKDGFLFAISFGGYLNFYKILNSGEVKNFHDEQNPIYDAANVECFAHKNGKFAEFWIKSAYYADSVSGLFANFYNENDSLLTENVLLIEYKTDDYQIYDNLTAPKILPFASTDSSYQILIANQDSLTVTLLEISFDGSKFSVLSKIQLPALTIAGDEWKIVRNFSATNFWGNRKKVFFNIEGDHKFNNYIFDLAKDGTLIGNILTDTSSISVATDKTFLNHNGEFFGCTTDGNDVFLTKFNNFSQISAISISDVSAGSNELSSQINIIDDNNALITWEDELGIAGQIIDKSGQKNGNKIRLEAKNFKFMNDGSSFAAFGSNYDSKKGFWGLKKFDSQFNKISEDTLFFSAQHSYLNVVFRLLQNKNILILFSVDSSFGLQIFDNQLHLIKETSLPNNLTGNNLQIFSESDSSFYILWGENIQLFSENLKPLNERKDLKFHPSLYLGNSRFLIEKINYEANPYYQGKIVDIDGNALSDSFIIGYHGDIKNVLLGNGKFLTVYGSNYYVYAKAFNSAGLILRNEFKVDDQTVSRKSNPVAVRWGDNILFTWSDDRIRENYFDIYGAIYKISEIVSVKTEQEIPNKFVLYQNYPNPFNPSTTISFSIPSSTEYYSVLQNVTLKVYDILGREVATLVNERKPAGMYNVQCIMNNVSSGVYFYTLKAGSYTETKKMLLMK
jgi:hypothetical protein